MRGGGAGRGRSGWYTISVATVTILVLLPATALGVHGTPTPTEDHVETTHHLSAAAEPEPVTLSFEEIPGSGSTTAGMHLQWQYEPSYGIEFVPPDDADYGASIVECGAFNSPCSQARVGEKVAEPAHPGCELCAYDPMTIAFDALQKEVSLYVTHRETSQEFTAVATLTAYDESGSQIDTERVTFPSDGGWQALAVGNPFGSARIASVTVAGGEDGEFPYDNEILVDDVSFTAETGEPDPDAGPPAIAIVSPGDGITVDYETAGTGVDFHVRANDDRQLSNVSYRVASGPWRLLCGSHEGVSVGACPSGSETYDARLALRLPTSDGTYPIRARACDLAGNCGQDDIAVTVSLPPPVAVTGLDPPVVHNGVVLREDPRWVVNGTQQVTLTGRFHDRTAVWLFGGCTVGEFPDYCAYRTEIPAADYAVSADRSQLTIEVPDDVPERLRLNRRFFWGVYDEIYGHAGDDSWSAENWARSPEFTFETAPRYSDAMSYRFENEPGASGRKVFQGTFGKVAFGCVPRTDACVPRPMYFTVWLPVFRGWLDSSGGSCVGLAATSQFLARTDDRFRMLGQPDDLTAEAFDEDANYASGLRGSGPLGRQPPKPADFRDYPKRPDNLWGVVRSAHGVQTSIEYIDVFATRAGAARATRPSEVVERVRADPTDYVLCMKHGSSGHCVSPYAVTDVDATTSRILVYDNNYPQDRGPVDTDGDNETDVWSQDGPRYVEVDRRAEWWQFPISWTKNASRPTYKEWNGSEDDLYAVPLSVWENKRHAPVDFIGAGADFRSLRHTLNIVFGGATPMYETDEGRWGWEPDGTFVDELQNATALPPSGQPAPDNRFVPLLLPPASGPTSVRITPTGGEYTFHTSRPGTFAQLRTAPADSTKTDRIEVEGRSDPDTTVRFSPGSERVGVVATVGNVYAEGEEAVFTLSGVSIAANDSIEVGTVEADRGVRYANDAGHTTTHTVAVRTFDATGAFPVNSTQIYGPFEVPDGAVQTLRIDDWPNASRLVVELDRDGDGSVDSSRTVDGSPCSAPLLAPDSNGNGIPDACEPPATAGSVLPIGPGLVGQPAAAVVIVLLGLFGLTGLWLWRRR